MATNETDTPINPDDRMTMPIYRMLLNAARCVERTAIFVEFDERQHEMAEQAGLYKREQELMDTYSVCIRARRAEVLQEMRKIGLQTQTEAVIVKHPLLCALGYKHRFESNMDGR